MLLPIYKVQSSSTWNTGWPYHTPDGFKSWAAFNLWFREQGHIETIRTQLSQLKWKDDELSPGACCEDSDNVVTHQRLCRSQQRLGGMATGVTLGVLIHLLRQPP